MKLANLRHSNGFFFVLLWVDLGGCLRRLIPSILLLIGSIINIRGLVLELFRFRVELVGIHLIIVVLSLRGSISYPDSVGARGSWRWLCLFICNLVQLRNSNIKLGLFMIMIELKLPGLLARIEGLLYILLVLPKFRVILQFLIKKFFLTRIILVLVLSVRLRGLVDLTLIELDTVFAGI